MSLFSVIPELVSVTAGDLSGIGSAIGEANSVAAGLTLGVVAPAADTVSAELAAVFACHAQDYQTVSTQAQLFHQDFVNTLSASGVAYGRAEAETVSGLTSGRIPNGLGVLVSRQHEIADGAGSRLWQPSRPMLWRSGMADPRLITPRHTLPAGSRLWHPGLPGFKNHNNFAPRLFTPHNELMGGIGNGPRGIVQNIAALIKQIIQNQVGYFKLTVTSLIDFIKDELKAVLGLPAVFMQSVKDLLHGNISGAMNDVLKGLAHLFVDGVEKVNKLWPGPWYEVAFTGALPDLWHLMQIPADEMQNLANYLKPLGFGIMGNLVQRHLADPLSDLANGWHMYLANDASPGFKIDKNLALLFDILGAPILSLEAFENGIQSSLDALLHGAPLRALADLTKTPADIMHAFLFGDGYLEIPGLSSDSGTFMMGKVHLGGIFAPLNYGQGYLSGYFGFTQITDPSRGTLTGGIVPALVSMLPPKIQGPLLTVGAFLDGLIAALERHPASP